MFEENERFNANPDIVLRVAPDCWKELKAGFTEECKRVTSQSSVHDFMCSEPDDDTFCIERMVDHSGIRELTFKFDRIVPQVIYEFNRCGGPRPIPVDFGLLGTRAFLRRGQSGLPIPELVAEVMLRIVRR